MRLELDAERDRRSCAACCTTTGCRSTRGRSPTTILAQEGRKVARRACGAAVSGGLAAGRRVNPASKGYDTSENTSCRQRHRNLRRRPTASASRCSRIAAARRRCAPAAATTRSPSASSTRSSRWAIDPRQVIKLSGIGCSSKSPAYFLGARARLQLRPRPDAVGRHRRDARQPEADRHRRQRRRRHRRDRHRPVRAPDAAQPADHLHHRGQRLLRPDQGAVLADRRPRLDAEERRRQRPAADRHLRAGDRARRVVRRALVLGRQEAAAVDPQGVAEPPRHRA